MQGINIVGVQFRRAGKIYDFAAGDIECKVGDQVVVDSERGPSLAKVCVVRYHNPQEKLHKKLKPILRKATFKEVSKAPRQTPEEVTSFTKEKVEKLELDMRVLKSEVQFGGSKVIVYFVAPGRVDFRELVKELASGLKARVELKQVGARDETKLLGGIGICGREYCCSSFLREFVPVSIRMAKNQNLALNPSKVSGGCGRLLCCLTYENDAYTHLRQILPPKGTKIKIIDTSEAAIVIKADLLNQLLQVELENGQQKTLKLSEAEIIDRSHLPSDHDDSEAEAAEFSDHEMEKWGEDLDLEALESQIGLTHQDYEDSETDMDLNPSTGGQSQRSASGQMNQKPSVSNQDKINVMQKHGQNNNRKWRDHNNSSNKKPRNHKWQNSKKSSRNFRKNDDGSGPNKK